MHTIKAKFFQKIVLYFSAMLACEIYPSAYGTLGVARNCRFLGYVAEPEKENLLNACDIVCVPSRNEPFGIIILESWDACKPVVATKAVSIIKNFADGILAYVEPESLAWCINRLLENPEEMKKLAKAGNERVQTEFNWNTIAKTTDAIYKKVL